QIGNDPFGPVLADQPNPLAAADPQRPQAERQTAHVARRRGPADRPIMSLALRPQKRLVAHPSRLVKEHRPQAAAPLVIRSSPVLAGPFYGFRTVGGIAVTRAVYTGVLATQAPHGC